MFLSFLAAVMSAWWAVPADGAVRTWVGGNNDWNFSGANWTGLDEPDPDDDAVFNTNNAVDMTVDNEVLSLDLSNDITLETRDQFLDVNGDVTLAGAGTLLRVGRTGLAGLPATSLSAYNVTVGADATFANANFTSFLDPVGIGVFDINVNGTLTGHGTIRNGDGIGSPTIVFSNDGVIRPGNVGGFVIIGNPSAQTLTLSAVDGDARINLDGIGGNGDVDISRNQTLDIDLELEDPFDGTIDLAHNATLDIEDAWTFSGVMNVDNGFVAGSPPVIPNVPADVAFLQGGAVTMSGGATALNVIDADGTLQIDTTFTANGGTINNDGLIVFNGDATINAGVDFQMLGVDSGLTVGPGADVEINDDDMDFDGSGASTNVITVEVGGLLDLNLDSFEGNDRADNFLTLNSGSLALTVTDNSWTMDRRLTLNNSTGTDPSVTGSDIVIGDDASFNGLPDADIVVTGTGSSRLFPAVTWNSDAEVDVDAGATFAVLGFSTFNTVNGAENARFDGPGNIRFSGGQVNEATTLDFSGGTVGLDGGGAAVVQLFAPDFTIDAPLNINADAIDPYGRTTIGPDTSILTINVFNGGQLDINLDNPNDAWNVNSFGIVNINGSNGLFSTGLDGSTLEMEGSLNVDGLVRSDARLVVGSTGTVNFVDAAANLRLRGGDLATPNRLEGGMILGLGEVSTPDAVALHGFGTIDTAIDFDGNTSELLADDGTLTLGANAAILDVGVIGTNDTDGTLTAVSPWNSSGANEVRLNGGSITGATITNDGANGIKGFGSVTAHVINNTGVDADDGGTLFLINAGNDWDGTTNTGVLRARTGDLELVDAGVVSFSGTVRADAGQEVFANGFGFDFQPGSNLNLNAGTFRSTTLTNLFGNVNIGAGTSTLDIAASAVFRNGANVTLNGDLVLDNTSTFINPGAAFSGGGSLISPAGHVLSLSDNADVDVLIDNHGDLTFQGTAIGNADGDDLQLNAGGTLHIDLAGTALTDFDRFVLTGVAQLGGTLDIDLDPGFDPVAGNQFIILSAAGSVLGGFDAANLAALDDGEVWQITYNATNVVLAVAAGIHGDYNDSGQVEQGDLDLVLQNWGDNTNLTGVPAGWINDLPLGQIEQTELDKVLQNWGDTAAPDFAGSSVPEPASLAVLGVVLAGTSRRRPA